MTFIFSNNYDGKVIEDKEDIIEYDTTKECTCLLVKLFKETDGDIYK